MANLKNVTKKTKAQAMGMHSEVLTGRTQQKFFNPDEAENFYYFGTYDVDFNKRTDLDVKNMTAAEANKELDNLMSQGYGTIVIKNPQGKHSLGVGILNKLNLIFEGSLGYFGMGSSDGPIVRINGRVGWSCAENLMAGKVVIEKNAGSCFGAAIRGGDLICKGSVGARTGIDMKGGTIIIGGDAGAFTGFMMQRGRIIILGDVGDNFAAGMTGGMAFIYDKSQQFEKKVNPESVVWQNVETDYWKEYLKNLVSEHFKETESQLSKKIIENFDDEVNNFVQVCPKEMLDKLKNPITLKKDIKKVS